MSNQKEEHFSDSELNIMAQMFVLLAEIPAKDRRLTMWAMVAKIALVDKTDWRYGQVREAYGLN